MAFATPALRALVPGPLPAPVAGYLAWWDPGAGRTPAGLFPLFPWMAYVFAGAAFGAWWARAAQRGRLRAQIGLFSAAGVLLALASCEALPPAFRLLSEWPVLTQPIRVAYRLGVALVLAGAALALSRPAAIRWLPLRALGSASLLVYWIHLEFAFGVAAKPLARSLSLGQWLSAFAVLGTAMTALAWIRMHSSRMNGKWLMVTPEQGERQLLQARSTSPAPGCS